MSMQHIEIAQNDGRTVQGRDNQPSSNGNEGVTIMSTMTRTAHSTRLACE